MVRKLDELGLVTHERYRGVELTERGTRLALEMIRHHRLLELYLAESLGVPWDRVHARGRGARARPLRRARGADRRQARPPDARPARRPDPCADLVIAEERHAVPVGARARGRGRRSPASRTPSRRCCATSPSARSSPGTRAAGRRQAAVRRPAVRRRRAARRTRSAASSPTSMRVRAHEPAAQRRSRPPAPRPAAPPEPPSPLREMRARGTRRAASSRCSARPSSPPSPTSTPATSPPTSPAAPSTATCCCG